MRCFFSDRVKKLVIYFGLYESSLHFSRREDKVNVIIIIIIIINNFFFVGLIQHFKVPQIVFRPKKLIKANCKPSEMKFLKDTFQQSFKLHICRWELRKKDRKKCTNAHIFTCAHMHKHIRTCKHTHAHIDKIT